MKTYIMDIVLYVIAGFIFFLSLLKLITAIKNKKLFKKSPVGWQVKYWIGECSNYGTVTNHDRDTDLVTIDTIESNETKFHINDVIPIFKRK